MKDPKEAVIIEESGVTARGYRHRTTVPKKIFQFFKLKDKDKLRWIALKDGTVIVKKAS